MSKIKTAEMASDIIAILLNFEEQLFSKAATRGVYKKRCSWIFHKIQALGLKLYQKRDSGTGAFL